VTGSVGFTPFSGSCSSGLVLILDAHVSELDNEWIQLSKSKTDGLNIYFCTSYLKSVEHKSIFVSWSSYSRLGSRDVSRLSRFYLVVLLLTIIYRVLSPSDVISSVCPSREWSLTLSTGHFPIDLDFYWLQTNPHWLILNSFKTAGVKRSWISGSLLWNRMTSSYVSTVDYVTSLRPSMPNA
jgi:hypothetical protein